MTKYRDFPRLLSLEISERKIAERCGGRITQYPISLKELMR